MRRILLSVLMVAAIGATPLRADAETDDLCLGVGPMLTAYPLVYSALGPPADTPWFYGIATGTCVYGLNMTATGRYTGWCDLGTGYGITSRGNRFAFVSVGQKIVYTGEVVGETWFVADPLAGSCFTGTTRFLTGWGGGLNWGCKVVEQEETTPGPLGLPLHSMTCV
ncbi:MAG: hypothetical protein M3394_06645 [Actinomycetota bacterium]|nr:hypothetical protein [Actinomycetota bacterium]